MIMHRTSKKRVRTSLAGDTETHHAKKLFRPGDKIEHHKSRESYFNIKSISQSYVTFLNRLENTAFDYHECGHRFRRKDGDTGQCPRGHERGTIKINVRGTLSCKSCKTTWNRDFNAAINIQKVFTCYRDENGSRPAFLSRMAMDC